MSRLAICVAFFVNGAGLGLWTPHIPLIRKALALDDRMLGLALLAMAVGSLVAMPLVSALITRFGSKLLVGVTGLAFCASMIAPANVHTVPLLFISLFAFGMCNGALDVSMNVQASRLERESGQPIMSLFHGMWSLGALIGSAIATALLFRAENAGLTMALGAAVLTPLLVAATFRLLAGKEAAQKKQLSLANRAVLVLAMLAVLAMMSEGALSDWSGVFLTERVGLSIRSAGLVFTGLALIGTLVRVFLGDRLVARFGSTAVLVASAALAATGVAIAISAPHRIVSPIGFALGWTGLTCLVPLVYSAAGRVPNAAPQIALGTVATLGYIGFLLGPPCIGALSHVANLSVGLALVPVACVGVGMTAWLRKL